MIEVLLSGVVAASASYVDVTNAIASAGAGGYVQVPAGSAYWSNSVTITDGLIIEGAGAGNTIISNSIPSAAKAYLFRYEPSDPSSDPYVDISGFTLDGNHNGGGIVVVNDTTNNLHVINNYRVHDNVIRNTRGNASGVAQGGFATEGMVYGLVDNNIFDNCSTNGSGTSNSYDLYLLGANEYSWLNPLEIGTENYLYIEDNIFTNSAYIIMDSGEGMRWVARHNAIETGLTKIFDLHGDTGNYGGVGCEIYWNTAAPTYAGTMVFLQQNGNVSITWSNTIGTTTSGRVKMLEQNADCVQVITNTYIWGNGRLSDGQLVPVEELDANGCFAEDINYFTDGEGTYGAAESPLNFTSDVFANRPATPADADCFWATDTETLYRSVGTNNWTQIYQPYTYPHPLRSGGGGGATWPTVPDSPPVRLWIGVP